MSIKKIILISLVLLVVVAAVFLYAAARKIYTPTKGTRIGKYSDPQKALLVIDLQVDYIGLNGRQPPVYEHVDKQINTINSLIDKASESGMKVVYIRQVFDNNFLMRHLVGRTIEGVPGVEMDPRVKVINQNDFTKNISDAFSNPKLGEFLVANHVDELYLVGLDAAYCVYNTAMGGKNRGYKVTVVKDAIMTQKNMADVLKHYETHGILTTTSGEMLGR